MGYTFTVLHTAAFEAVSQALAGGSFWPQGGRIEMRKGRPADGLFLLTAAMAGFATCGSASRVSDRIPFKVADPRPQPFRIEARSVPMQDGRSSRGRPMKAPMLLASARLSAIAALFLATFPTILMGQTSEEYAAMGQKIWVAFECGALAEYADKPEESRRLYNLGYDQGKTLLDAFRAGKVDQQARGKLPIPVSSMLDGGPTVDFVLGRIFESAMQDTSRQLFEASNNTETRKIIAGQTFAKRNCELL
jgi:hypothetical protein